MKKFFFVTFIASILLMGRTPVEAASSMTTIYPTDDAMAQLYDGDGISNWEIARNYSGIIANPVVTQLPDALGTIAIRSDDGAGKYRIYRVSNTFDLNSLPESAVIESARLFLYRAPNNNAGNVKVVVTSHERENYSVMQRQDWPIDNFGNAEFSRKALIIGGYTEFLFNQEGINYLNSNRQVTLGLLTNFDFDNIEPIGFIEAAGWYSVESPGTSTDPYLEITYTVEDERKYVLYTQTESPYPSLLETAQWADEQYANGTSADSCGTTIGECGCAITSLVMAARNAGITEDILGGDVNPGNMNAYLEEISGYTSGGSLRWLAAQAYFGEFTSEGKIASRFATAVERPQIGQNVMSFIEGALNDGSSAVLAYKNGHFVWLPEKTSESYLVNDPWWYNTLTADDKTGEKVKDYNNSFSDARVLGIADEAVPFSGSDIEVHVQGTAELLYTRATGQQVGYKNGAVVIDLEHASYGDTEIISLSGGGNSNGKHLIVPNAGNQFTLEVMGTGTGAFVVEFFTISATGEVTTFELEGSTLPGVSSTFTFNLETGEVVENPLNLEQFLALLKVTLQNKSSEQQKFFAKWAEKMFERMEEKTVTQAIQTIEVYKKLLVAKKIENEWLTNSLDILEGSL